MCSSFEDFIFFSLWRLPWNSEIYRFSKIVNSDTNWIFPISFSSFFQRFVKCDPLRDLVPFVQFKKREKYPWRSVNFSTPLWMFFTFLKMYKWYIKSLKTPQSFNLYKVLNYILEINRLPFTIKTSGFRGNKFSMTSGKSKSGMEALGGSDRSSHQRCSMKKDNLKNFAKFTAKHLYQSLFFNKVVFCRVVFQWVLRNF